jgi:hypothetical protein
LGGDITLTCLGTNIRDDEIVWLTNDIYQNIEPQTITANEQHYLDKKQRAIYSDLKYIGDADVASKYVVKMNNLNNSVIKSTLTIKDINERDLNNEYSCSCNIYKCANKNLGDGPAKINLTALISKSEGNKRLNF